MKSNNKHAVAVTGKETPSAECFCDTKGAEEKSKSNDVVKRRKEPLKIGANWCKVGGLNDR